MYSRKQDEPNFSIRESKDIEATNVPAPGQQQGFV
jgi:hypothetical protein